MLMNQKINILDVSLRDGLQNLTKRVDFKIRLMVVKELINSGIKNIQIGSFVNPKIIPQMKNLEMFIDMLPKEKDVSYSGLVFNAKGVERAIRTGINRIETSISISETYNKINLGMSTAKAFDSLKSIISICKENRILCRPGLQCVWGCHFEGNVKRRNIINKISRILELGTKRISLCDTTGQANPKTVSIILEDMKKNFPDVEIAIHLHDNFGRGLTNLCEALNYNISEIDTTLGGIGGSPFIRNPNGNIGTEKSLEVLEKLGFNADIDKNKISAISKKLKKIIEESRRNEIHFKC